MQEFPRLNLGLYLTFYPFICLFLLFIGAWVFGVVAFSRSRLNMPLSIGISFLASFLATLGTAIFFYSYIAPYASSELHRFFNKHMPEDAVCIYYETDGYELQADYRVSYEAMKAWVEKYSLRELSLHEKYRLRPHPFYSDLNYSNKLSLHVLSSRVYQSKLRDNGSNIVASYNPTTHIVSIRYVAW